MESGERQDVVWTFIGVASGVFHGDTFHNLGNIGTKSKRSETDSAVDSFVSPL